MEIFHSLRHYLFINTISVSVFHQFVPHGVCEKHAFLFAHMRRITNIIVSSSISLVILLSDKSVFGHFYLNSSSHQKHLFIFSNVSTTAPFYLWAHTHHCSRRRRRQYFGKANAVRKTSELWICNPPFFPYPAHKNTT